MVSREVNRTANSVSFAPDRHSVVHWCGPAAVLDLYLVRHFQSVVDLRSKVADRTIKGRVIGWGPKIFARQSASAMLRSDVRGSFRLTHPRSNVLRGADFLEIKLTV